MAFGPLENCEERLTLRDAETSANWTMVGLCTPESTMSGGKQVVIPTF